MSTIASADGSPIYFPTGLTSSPLNDIGLPGAPGFGVGVAPSLPANFARLYGTEDRASDNYGNYQYSDGSVMVYVPAFFYKYGTGNNGLALNVVDIKAFAYFADVNTANAAGYAMHRAFYNGGAVRPGFFYDKYKCSLNGNVASSIKNGIVLSSAVRGGLTSAVFASCTGNGQTPANAFFGSIAAAKSRGSQFFPHTQFMRSALALLSLAHGSASTGAAYNAWYSSGATNFPKGYNNNALGDVNDASIAYASDGATGVNSARTGSANFFAKTTHNGQPCGVADLNGLIWDIEPFGVTSNGANYFLLNTAVDAAGITGGNTLATDAWGANGLAAMYTNIGATHESLTASGTNKAFGSAAQVLSSATSGTAWGMAGAGVPLLTGVGGSNQFGSDYMYDARPNELCVIGGAYWDNSSYAGSWARNFGNGRSTSGGGCGFSSACFL